MAEPRAGDWDCPSCGDHQFARRDACRSCGEPRPGGGGAVGAVAGGGARSGGGGGGGGGGYRRGPRVREGDWNCSSCGDHQFASRTECRKCGAAKPADAGMTADEVEAINGPRVREGDWNCAACGDHQFASRTECRKCGAAKPDGAGITADEAASAAASRPARPARARPMKDGDWLCPKCGDHQFASRTECRMCSEPKPADAGAGEGLPAPGGY